jgi:hypothetical protein
MLVSERLFGSQMKLGGYLDTLSWSQAELSRRAKVSVGSISRALAGDRVSRRVADAIVQALSKGLGRRLTLDDVDIQIVGFKRRKRNQAASSGQSEKQVERSKKSGTSGGEMKS